MLNIDSNTRQQWQELVDNRAEDLDACICLFLATELDAPWFISKNTTPSQLEMAKHALSSATYHISVVFDSNFSIKLYPIFDNNDVVIAHLVLTASSHASHALENLELDTLVIYFQHHLQQRQKELDPLSSLSAKDVLDSMDDHCWIKDLAGVYRYTNSRVKNNLNMTPDEVLGRTDSEIFDAETAEIFKQADFRAIKERKQIVFPRYSRFINDSEKVWSDSTKAPIFNKNGEIIGLVGASRDIVNDRDTTKQLYRLAYFDSLTELSNRTHLMFELSKKINFAKQNHSELALLSVDIDFFQRINESYSHKVADTLLIKVAKRLKKELPSHTLLARIDGDEFAVAFISPTARKESREWATRIQKIFQTPLQLAGNKEIRLSISIGIAIYPEHAPNVDGLLRHANAALARAKQLGRNRVEYYSSSLNYAAERLVQIQEYLYRALKEHYFHLVYQKKVSLRDKKVFGYEALLRMEIPSIGYISPNEFIPVAESSGLIIDIGTWVLEQACTQAKKWLAEGHPFDHIAVNVSAAQLNNGDFIERLKFIFDMTELPPERLQLEITESVLMENQEQVIKTLNEINSLGIRLAMDDFGTGYSSLSYLKDLPLSQLKIDRSFIVELTNDALNNSSENEDKPNCKAIVQATIAMAKAFKLSIVAEGIEHESQATILEELGCEYGQGFLYHKPERF